MILYSIPLIISFIGVIIYDINGRDTGKKFWWIFLFIYMTLFMGLRYGVGGDTIIYMADYIWTPTLKNYTIISVNRFDPGFNFLMSIGKTISEDFVAFQFLHVLIFNTLLFYVIHKYSKYQYSVFFCGLFVFYYYFTTEILRESLAVLIFVSFYKYYAEKKWIKYLFIVILCALVHRAALFLLVLPFLSWVKFNKWYVILFIGTVGVGVSLQNVFSLLNNISFLADNSKGYQSDTSHGLLADILTFTRQALFPLIIALLIKYRNGNRNFKFENMLALLVLFGTLSFFSPIIFSRICNYFIIFFTIVFSDCIITLIKSHLQVACQNAIILFVFFISLYGSSYIMYNYYIRLVPYYSIFTPINVERDNFK